MRKILFRGKRISNGEWVYGGIMKVFHPNYDSKSKDDFFNEVPNCYCICADGKDYFVEQGSIGQYTGLTDKNGKKIFEGDIFKFKDGYDKGVVKFEQYKSSFNHEPKNVGFFIDWERKDGYATLREDLGYWAESNDVEIIGNKFENPELLEVKQ